MPRIQFIQPKPRVEDWRVQFGQFTIGSVWRAGEGRYICNCTHSETAPSIEAAFKLARKQARIITAA